MNKSWFWLLVAIGAINVAFSCFIMTSQKSSEMKIGFVNSERVITGFKPAYEVEKGLLEKDSQFKAKLKVLEDSTKAFMDSMSVRYDNANQSMKKQIQDELSARNQQINNLNRAHMRAMEEERTAKMQGVYNKINSFLKEFGKGKGYSILFGTVQGGNILYGEGTSADVTEMVINGLNDRYK